MTTRLRTWVLIAGLSALFVSLGAFVGGTGGLVLFLLIAVGFNFAMYWFSDRIALKVSRAQPLERSAAPEIYADVEELAQRAGLPVPRLYVIPSEQPNAFATGRSPKHSAVAVTEGLMRDLPREQVRGVLAHELAHVLNRDVLVTTVAAMIGAAITAVAHFLQFSWLFGGDEDDSPLGFVGTLAAILIAPIAAMILQLAVSRQREYLADATAAKLLGRGAPARVRARVAAAWRRGGPGDSEPRDRLALHRKPAFGRGDGLAVLDPPADGCAHRTAAGDRSGSGERLVAPAATASVGATSERARAPSGTAVCRRAGARRTGPTTSLLAGSGARDSPFRRPMPRGARSPRTPASGRRRC